MLEIFQGLLTALIIIVPFFLWIKWSEYQALAKVKPVPVAATPEPANKSCRPQHELIALEKNAGITPSDNETEHENRCRLYATELIHGEWKVITRNQQKLPTLGLARPESTPDNNICPATGAMRETHYWRVQGANMLQCSYCGKTKNQFNPTSPQSQPSISRSNTKTTCSNAPSELTNHVWKLGDNNILRCVNCGVSQNEFTSFKDALKQIRSNITLSSAADYQRKQLEILLDIKRRADTAISEGQIDCPHSDPEIVDEIDCLDGTGFTMWRCARCRFEWTYVRLTKKNKP